MKTENEKDSLILGAAFVTTEMLGFRQASPSFCFTLLNNHMGGFWYPLKSNLTPHGSNLSAISFGTSLAFLAIFFLVRYYGLRLQPELPLYSALSGVR
jgi:hypothetical protein